MKDNTLIALTAAGAIGGGLIGWYLSRKPPEEPEEPPWEPGWPLPWDPEDPEDPMTVEGLIGLYGPAWVLTQSEWYAAGFTGSRYDGSYAQWKYAFELANPSMNFESYVITNIGYDPPYEWWAYWGRYD